MGSDNTGFTSSLAERHFSERLGLKDQLELSENGLSVKEE